MSRIVAARIQGIPCAVEVTHYYVTHEDWDPIEFKVLDRRGRPAPWLERKMTDEDVAKIEERIARALG